jgi:hypothetical protein
MRYKLHVSRYSSGRALVCGILGGGHLPWTLLLLLVLGGESEWGISRPEHITCVALEIRRIDVLLLVLVLLWCWKLSVALEHSCTVTGAQCRIGVPSTVIVTVVTDSTCGTDTVLCCMWESLFN